VILPQEASMTTQPFYDRDTTRRLIQEAKAQRKYELQAAADQALGAVRWSGVAVACVACLAVVGVTACAGSVTAGDGGSVVSR
jgi:hypothetical protein